MACATNNKQQERKATNKAQFNTKLTKYAQKKGNKQHATERYLSCI